MVVRRVQKSHRISIPPEIWSSLGLREGDKVEVVREGDRIVILPVSGTKSPTDMLWNMSENPTPTNRPDEVIEEGMGKRVAG